MELFEKWFSRLFSVVLVEIHMMIRTLQWVSEQLGYIQLIAENKGHHLYCVNYYTSPALFSSLGTLGF